MFPRFVQVHNSIVFADLVVKVSWYALSCPEYFILCRMRTKHCCSLAVLTLGSAELQRISAVPSCASGYTFEFHSSSYARLLAIECAAQIGLQHHGIQQNDCLLLVAYAVHECWCTAQACWSVAAQQMAVLFVLTEQWMCEFEVSPNSARLYCLVQDEQLKWLEDLGNDRAEWLRQLPFSLSVPSLNLLVVHAGLIPGIPLKKQSLKTLTEV